MALTAKTKKSQPGVVHMTAISILRLATQTACATEQVPGQPGLYDSLSKIKKKWNSPKTLCREQHHLESHHGTLYMTRWWPQISSLTTCVLIFCNPSPLLIHQNFLFYALFFISYIIMSYCTHLTLSFMFLFIAFVLCSHLLTHVSLHGHNKWGKNLAFSPR